MNIQSISASNWVALSCVYTPDDNINIISNLVQWNDGYSSYVHPALSGINDFSFNKNTLFCLPTSQSLFDFMEDTGKSNVILGAYIYISIDTQFSPALQYVSTNSDNELVLVDAKDDNCFFRFIVNSDNTFSLLQRDNLYVTVDANTPFNLTLQEALDIDNIDRQKFYWHTDDNEHIYFTVKMTSDNTYEPTTIERYWSYSKAGPYIKHLRANGIVLNNPDMVLMNSYLFNVEDFFIYYVPSGLVSDHIWVNYYNDFKNKIYSKDTTINNKISGIKINHLFDSAFMNNVDASKNNISINFSNLKNILTPEYENNLKKE